MSFYRSIFLAFIQLVFFSLCQLASTSLSAQGRMPVKVQYQNGLNLEFPDSDLNTKTKLSFAGRVHYDLTLIDQSTEINNLVGEAGSSQQFRRIFLMHSGELFYGKLSYKIQFDFTGGQIGFRDIYIEPRLFKAGSFEGFIRVGQFKDPFRFENMLSGNNLSLLERSYIANFAPLRNTGLMYHMHSSDQKFSFQFAFLENSTDTGKDISPDDGHNITTRVTYLPLHEDDLTLHLGAAISIRDRGKEGKYTLKAKPPVFTLPNYLSFAIDDVEDVRLLNFEAVLIRRQLMIMSEVLIGSVNAAANHTADAYYGQVSYLINKDSYHTYKNSLLGIKDHISEKGAWEFALRFAAANFKDESPVAPAVSDLTFGTIYYFNEQLRVMLNLSHIHLRSAGNAKALSIRLQTTF